MDYSLWKLWPFLFTFSLQKSSFILSSLIPFSSFFFSGLIDKKEEKTKTVLYFLCYVHSVIFICNTCTFSSIKYNLFLYTTVLVCVLYWFSLGFVIFPKRERLLSCTSCFSLFLLLCFGIILKPSLNLFFSYLFWLRNGILGLPSADA